MREAVRNANLQPPSDVHASAEYRRHLAEVCAVRAVQQATAQSSTSWPEAALIALKMFQ